MKQINIPNQFELFLSYEQLSPQGFEYGLTHVYYQLDNNCIYFKFISEIKEDETTEILKLKSNSVNYKEIINDFLIEYFTIPQNTIGRLLFDSSSLFSEEEFNQIKETCRLNQVNRINEHIEKASNNELILFLTQQGLSPIPTYSDGTNWYATCPNQRKHSMMVNTHSNQWGCGYCRKKGNLNDLKEWCDSLKKS